MPMSNRDRIARAQAEAAASATEKAAKAAKKPATKAPSRAKAAATPQRMKIVWEIFGPAGKALKTFPYADKELAEAEVKRLNGTGERRHELRGTKVPME